MAEALTPRQTEVLIAVLSSCSRKEAAHELGVSIWTVRGHLARIRDRLDVENVQQAAYIAGRRGLIVPTLDRCIRASVHPAIPADTDTVTHCRAQGRARRSSLVGGQP